MIMMARGAQGGHPGIPPTKVPAGGVELTREGKIAPQGPQVGLPPRTKKTVSFQNCQIGVYAVLDEENVCQSYKLVLADPWENIQYEFDFLDDVREMLETQISQFPLIGEKPAEVADGGN